MEKLDYKALFVEVLMRENLCFPITEEQKELFEKGHDIKTPDGKDYFMRISHALDVASINLTDLETI